MNVLGDLIGKFDSDNLKVLVSKDTDEDANNDSNLYRDQGIPLDPKDTNIMEAMLLSDDGFMKGKYMDSIINIYNFIRDMIHKLQFI